MAIIEDVHIALSRSVDGALELKRQRDALLEACKLALMALDDCFPGEVPTLSGKLRAAIALTEGEQNHV